jgi:PAS domain S-box-containing protein
MKAAPLPSNEVLRLRTLQQYDILNTEAEAAFDDLTALAAFICQTPIAFISFIGADLQWFKSKMGLETTETPRESAFCAHTILQSNQAFIVSDALEDERFVNNPLVVAAPYIRFYAGYPLVAPNGCAVGTLGVVDQIPRNLTSEQIKALQTLSRQVVNQLEQRRSTTRLKHTRIKQRQIITRLRAEKNLMSAVLETAGALVVVLDPLGRIVHFNRACEQTTYYSFEEVKGQYFWDIFLTTGEIESVKQVFAQLQAGQFPNQHENDWVTREGQRRRIAWSNTAILNPHGFVEYVIGTGIDVTERRLAEAAVQRLQQQQYQALVDSIGGILWERDLQTLQFTIVSQKAEQLLGYPAEQWLHNPDFWENHVHLDDREWVIAQCNVDTQAKRDHELEYRMIAADGQVVWVQDLVSVVVTNDQPVKLRGVILDITDRKETEEALLVQIERERIMVAIARRIRESLDLETILRTAVTEVQQLLQVDRVLVYRVWADGTGSTVTESVLPGQATIVDQTFPEEVFPQEYQQLYCQGRVRAIADVITDDIDPCLVEFLQQFEVRAKLVVPILQETGLWGLLIAHQCNTPRQWQSQELELLQQLATQLAIAIQQSGLYEQVKQFNASLEFQVQERTTELQQALNFEALLKRITDKVRDSLDEDQILQTAVKELAIGLNLECCDAALFDLERRLSTIYYEHICSMIPPAIGMATNIDTKPEIYSQLLEGKYLQFCITPFKADWSRNHLKHCSAILSCPLMDDQKALGDLWLFKPKESSFDEQEIRLVQQVANQCAIALRQARLYKASQAQIVELEKLNRLKDDFLSTVSHEMRSPVSNMKMAIQMLELTLQRNNYTHISPTNELASANQVTRYLQILNYECKREIELINDLLDLQRLEAGFHSLTLSEIPLQSWLLLNAKPFRERTQNRQQKFEINIASDLPRFVSDPACLERIVVELLTNACKYTPPEETISLTARAESEAIQIQVCNFGTEIPVAELPNIFDKFYRVPNADPWRQGGTGLGLALVKKMVEHLGGSIEVISAENQTCFTVEIPAIYRSDLSSLQS